MIEFLKAVLPTAGNYVLHTENKKSTGGKWHKNYHTETLEDLETQALEQDKTPTTTVYYALGAYKDNIDDTGKVWRTQEKADRFKTLAFDVDPKDKDQNVIYDSQKGMAQATLSTCQKLGLPDPVFVSSGNGLHCYYPLTVEVSKVNWVRLSSMLRDALTSVGMVLDVSKICDPSMVLRPPSTHNKKDTGVKQVRLLSKIEFFDPSLLASILKKVTPVTKVSKTSKPSTKKSAVMDAILETDFPPSDSSLIEYQCAHISAIAQTGGKIAEPLWRLAIGIAKHCVDPVTTAHRWSDQDPRYTVEETDEKLIAWKTGPSTCKKFEEHDKGLCAACPHKGLITSPIQLGIPTVTPAIVEAVGASIQLPKGYSIKGTKLFRIIDGEASFVSDYLLFPTNRYKDHDTCKSMCLVAAQLPKEGWVTLDLSMDTLSKQAEFSQWLSNHQLFVHNDATTTAMRKYMLTYLQELQQDTESDIMCGSFGWTDEDCTKFVLGNKLIEKSKNSTIKLSNLAADFEDALSPRGDRDKWVKATSMFNAPGMQLHGLVFLMSMGSPLMVGSGLKSVLVNMFSESSGTGKTTTGLFANSVYGNPNNLMLTVKDTDNSIFKTMGVYGNLPVYIDEITELERTRLGPAVYFITQGREKKRMTKEGGMQTSVEWASITTTSSNKNMYELLGEQVSSEGETMRLLQISISENELFNSDNGSDFGYEMALFLRRNYGLVGEEFIRGIIELGGPEAIYDRARTHVTKKYKFVFLGKERFWQAAIVVAHATGQIAKHLGIIDFNYEDCIREGLSYISKLRIDMGACRLDAFDTIGLYMNEHASKTAVFKRNSTLQNDGSVLVPYPHEAVARVEVVCTNNNPFSSGRMYINQVHFNQWCRERGIDRRGVFKEFAAAGVTTGGDHRIALMKGTDKPLPAVRVFNIELTHPRFVTIMHQNELGIIPSTHLKLVKTASNANAN